MRLLVPSTYGADERDMRIKVVKYGMLARAASIYGCDRITIYRDEDEKLDQERNADLMAKHLRYAETPPYLRKELIPYDEDLEYANILPALQIISHGYSEQFREAIVEENENGELTLEAGTEHKLTTHANVEEGERVTVKVLDNNQATIIDPETIQGFWTFTVERRDEPLGDVLASIDQPVIGTSFHGQDVHEVADDISAMDDPAVVFGSAWRGIPSMAERGDLEEDQIDCMVNLVPEQETKTVRTEEAFYIGLSLLDYIRS